MKADYEKLPRFDVLDHGHVILVDHMGNDLSVVRAARVSYDAQWRAGDDQTGDEKLLRYLWKNHHTTPFEAVTFTFDVKAPIFVFRQWHRHRTWSYNELSARYKELPAEFYLPQPALIGEQSKSSKQARIVPADHNIEQIVDRELQVNAARETMENAFKVYADLLAAGWPRELARSVLPVATYSHMQCTVNLLNLLKFLTLRTHSHAQFEIRVYAQAMLDLIRPIVPVTVSAWESTQPKEE